MHKVHSADGATIAYEKSGHSLPLLVIHGDYVDHSQWNTALPFLAQDFTTYVMDRRGHGKSDPYRTGHTLERDVEDTLAVLETIHEPACLLGHATGAYIALEAAARSAFATRVVLYEPPVVGAALNLEPHRSALSRCLAVDDRQGLITIVLNDISGATTGRELPPAAINGLLQSAYGQILLRNARSLPAELASYAAYEFDVERFRSFTLPTLFLLGSYSPPFNSLVTEKLRAVLPQSKTALLEGQEHNAMTTAPELLAQVLRTQLRGGSTAFDPAP
ncbi:Non-heme chloroperoxidase [Thermoflexales bacterium]|nr:Non-heme chloroperoxidase [Thermoflexales bacterium]